MQENTWARLCDWRPDCVLDSRNLARVFSCISVPVQHISYFNLKSTSISYKINVVPEYLTLLWSPRASLQPLLPPRCRQPRSCLAALILASNIRPVSIMYSPSE